MTSDHCSLSNDNIQEAQLFLRRSQSYSNFCNSNAACWRWLFQTWKFWRLTCLQDDIRQMAPMSNVQDVKSLRGESV